MNADLIQAFQNIGIDAIKILGPAIIAAVVAYKVAKTQSDVGLKQTDKRNEFEARKAGFDLLIQRQEELNKNYKQASENLAFVMGARTGLSDDDEDFSTFIDFSNITLRTVQRTSKLTKKHFQKQKLTDTEEFGAVESSCAAANGIQPATDFETLHSNSLALMPIYEEMNYALNAVVDREMDKILDPYIDENSA
jgi:hypothetical protein